MTTTTPAGSTNAGPPPARPEPLSGPRTTPDGRTFPWGPIDAVHTIGPYEIVEFRWDASRGPRGRWTQHGTTFFHPYVNGCDTERYHSTLDGALVDAVAFRSEGPNSSAGYYFLRMIGAGTDGTDGEGGGRG
ncbi:hypothetical protein [Saccharothrix sp. HUAS TT1]|uniref:hypothetical protein n=1 Tax=unclassified Saccharothrix TaxID=2593673 RepID=UPI00345C5007